MSLLWEALSPPQRRTTIREVEALSYKSSALNILKADKPDLKRGFAISIQENNKLTFNSFQRASLEEVSYGIHNVNDKVSQVGGF
jgi:hypothetical protein